MAHGKPSITTIPERFSLKDECTNDLGDIFGIVQIEKISVTKPLFNQVLSEIVLSPSNLSFIFQMDLCEKETANQKKMLRRFLPEEETTDIDNYVESEMKEHQSFYSFLAEAMIAILLKDLYGYHLAAAAIDINHTLNDTESGVDGCLYDEEKNLIVLAEAKFYSDGAKGIDEIKKNLTQEKSFLNKLKSLYRTAINNDKSYTVMISKLETVKEVTEVSFSDFLNMDLCFAGLSVSDNNCYETAKDLKVKSKFNSNDIVENVKILSPQSKPKVYYLRLFQLPIHSKKELIAATINLAKEKIKAL